MNNYFKKTLNRQFTFLLLVVALVITIVGGLLVGYGLHIQSNYEQQRAEMLEKQEVVFEIDSHAKQMLIRARGYYAFQDNDELNALYEEMDALKRYVDRFSSLNLSAEDLALLTEIRTTIHVYQAVHLPQALNLVRTNDLAGLTDYANSGATDTVNQLIINTSNYVIEIAEQGAEASRVYTDNVNQLVLLFVSFMIIVILVLFIVLRQMMKRVGRPIQEITKAAAKLAIGKEVTIVGQKRCDEVGVLSRTFLEMIETIQSKEDEMIQQNIELKTQQEELESKQEQLLKSLHETEGMRNVLVKYNSLNHAISVTLNKKDLFDQLIDHLSDIYPVDKMLLFLTEGSLYRSRGIHEKYVQQILTHFNDGIGTILTEKKDFHLVERKVTDVERGIAEGSLLAYDLYIPIFSSTHELRAVFATNRVGKPFTEVEINELRGVMNHLAIAIDKVLLYEQTEKERRLNQDIINYVNEAIQFVDEKGTLLQYNKAFCELVSCQPITQARAPYSKWFEAFSQIVEKKEEAVRFYKEALNQHNRSSSSMDYETISPQKRMFKVYAEPVFNHNQKVGTIFVHRDITQQYAVDQMKSELVSTVSHELRTPLSSILGFTELMIQRDLKPERQQKYLQTIHKEANRLTNLINDFLDLQRMESGGQTYVKERIDIKPTVDEVVSRFEPNTKKHSFIVENQARMTTITGDRDRIDQVLTNLISNAIKFSPEGGLIKIILQAVDKQLLISITDQGLGIPDEEMSNLFRKFYRIDNTDRKKIGGTGLGLPICKEIIEAHNGMIRVESKVGQGSTFTIELPLSDHTSTISSSYLNNEEKRTVLMVEDDQSLALLLAEELIANGLEVQQFSNPKKALEYMNLHSIDAVVVDLMLGDEMDGWEFIRFLKNNEEFKQIPIFISSALDEIVQTAREHGVEEYLTKPYPPSELSITILKTLLQAKSKGEILAPSQSIDPNPKVSE
ncbi:ATP-binding protein [Alkalihalophilus lindianensis]|uniref:histidine kinase n=1 Tax=Alkalihalophilus lindianensis TaxID=1630542 RepID=A0ABU3X5Y1_9BACI|nr:ATP-binding protein [Alkalihalophilus lindianensis]MDV2683296.1 ATP-binding protein [Alkalihalophilus lindianensis]